MNKQEKHRIYHIKLIKEGQPAYLTTLNSPADAVDFIQRRIGRSVYEHFLAIFLNNQHIPLGWREICRGGMNATVVQARDVYLPAIKLAATRVIVAHNHPGGSVKPSNEDIQLTKLLKAAGELLGIELLDHLIITDTDFLSLKDKGVL